MSSKIEASNSELLPTVPSEVTASWLSSILGPRVKSVEFREIALDQTTSKIHISLAYEDGVIAKDRPRHLCIKGNFNPEQMKKYRDTLLPLSTHEVKFFNDILPKLNHMSTIKVWWTGLNKDQDQAILLMEDMVLQGCKFGQIQQSWSIERVKEGLEQLASLHASTWNASAEYSSVTSNYEQVVLSLTEKEPWEYLLLGADRPPFPDFLKDRERTIAVLNKHYTSKNPKFFCIVHGDPHAANTYTDQEGKLHLYDWQLWHFGSAFHDVAYFIVGALSVQDRRDYEMPLLEYYLESLHQFGGPSLSIDDKELLNEYSKSTLAGIGWVFCPYSMHSKEDVFAMCERYCAAMVDHKAFELAESS